MKIALITYTDWLPELTAYDFCIAVDSGIKQFVNNQSLCDYWIGDFDSTDHFFEYQKFARKIIRLPQIKDETDTHAALLYAIEQLSATEITIITTHSGRFDHQYAQVLLCEIGTKAKVKVEIISPTAKIEVLKPGRHIIKKSAYPYLSIFAWQAPVTHLTITGTQYQLTDVTLAPTSPVGISNEISNQTATIIFATGTVLLIQSRD